jgi:hypothetical protein
MTIEEIRRVVEVDLLGQIHGMKAALPHLRDAGGTIINVTSALGNRAVPLQAAYVAAKHGVAAFGEALRLELRHDRVPVHIVDVQPSSVNTPLYGHARSKLGVMPRPLPPVYEPRVVAAAILSLAERPVRRVFVGVGARVLDAAQRLSPVLADWLLLGPGRVIENQKTDRPDDRRDNLDEPSTGPGQTTGQFGQRSKSTSLYTAVLGMHPARGRIAAAVMVGGGLAAVRWLGRRR